MKLWQPLTAVLIWLLTLPAHAACNNGQPIRLAEMNYASNQMAVDIERFIMENGYDCKTQTDSGSVLFLLAATLRGDIDVFTELWPNSTTDAWHEEVKEGKVKAVGDLYTGGYEGWYIPRYMAERYPDLKSVADLKRYQKELKDPEQPNKGRVLSCPGGWMCDIVNRNLLKAYHLDQQFNLVSPGSGAALKAAIETAYRRKQNIVFYYWAPTPLLGELDLVKLDMEPFDAAGYERNLKEDAASPSTSDFPKTVIQIGLNAEFAKQNPELTNFLSHMSIPATVANKLLAKAEADDLESRELALYFLNNYPQIWQHWVPEDVASKVSEALKNTRS